MKKNSTGDRYDLSSYQTAGDLLYINTDSSGTTPQWIGGPAMGTAVPPQVTIGYDAGVEMKPIFCNHCGNPLIDGKIIRYEYNSENGLLTYKWHLYGCQKIRWVLKRPWIVRLFHKYFREYAKKRHFLAIQRYNYSYQGNDSGWKKNGYVKLSQWWTWNQPFGGRWGADF